MSDKSETETIVERLEGADPARPVGYRNPPKRSQFKKGESGNRRGRPKGRLNAKTLFEKRMSEQVTVVTGANSRVMAALDAGFLRLRNDMIQGKPKAFSTVVALLREFGSFNEEVPTTQAPLTANDKALIADFLAGQKESTTPSTDKADGELPSANEADPKPTVAAGNKPKK